MKLSEALEHQERILDLTSQLNLAIRNARNNGLNIELEIIELHYIGGATSAPQVTSRLLVNPQDID